MAAARPQRARDARVGRWSRETLRSAGLAAEHHETARCVTIAVRADRSRSGPRRDRVRRDLGPAGGRGGGGDRRVLRRDASTASSTSAWPGSIACWAATEEIRRAQVVMVVAGMEGALPSVVGGLVEAPVIAVPDLRRLRGLVPGPGRPAGHAQLLRIRRRGRQHRQRVRGRVTSPAPSSARSAEPLSPEGAGRGQIQGPPTLTKSLILLIFEEVLSLPEAGQGGRGHGAGSHRVPHPSKLKQSKALALSDGDTFCLALGGSGAGTGFGVPTEKREREHFPYAGIRDASATLLLSHAGSAAGRERVRALAPAGRRRGAVREALATNDAKASRLLRGAGPPALPRPAGPDRGAARGAREGAAPRAAGAARTWPRSSRAACEIAQPRGPRRGRARARARRLRRVPDMSDLAAPSAARCCPPARWRTTRRPASRRRGARSTRLRAQLQSVMEGFLRGKDADRLLQDKLVTTRNDRYVLLLKAEHRGQIPGIIHGGSGSGASLFVEPHARGRAEQRHRLAAGGRAAPRSIRILRELTSRVGARSRRPPPRGGRAGRAGRRAGASAHGARHERRLPRSSRTRAAWTWTCAMRAIRCCCPP